MTSLNMQDITHWAKEWGPRARRIKELYPPHIQKKITTYKQRWSEAFEYDNIPFRDRKEQLYYFIIYKIYGTASEAGYIVLNAEGEAVPWDEAYPVAVQSLLYRQIVENGVFWNMRRIVSGKFVRRIRTILRELRKLQAVAEKSGEVEVQQSIKRMIWENEISLEYGLQAEEGYRLGKEHVDAVLARGYATEEDLRALYRIACEKFFFPVYRNINALIECEQDYAQVKRFMWKNLWRLVVRNPFGTWGLWNYIKLASTEERQYSRRVALDSYEVHPVTKERRTFALQKEMMGEYCEYQWRTSVAETEMMVRKMLRNPNRQRETEPNV